MLHQYYRTPETDKYIHKFITSPQCIPCLVYYCCACVYVIIHSTFPQCMN